MARNAVAPALMPSAAGGPHLVQERAMPGSGASDMASALVGRKHAYDVLNTTLIVAWGCQRYAGLTS